MENAFLVDICLGFPLGKIWFPSELPEVEEDAAPETFLLKGKQLASAKLLAERKDSSIVSSIIGLKSRADNFLGMPNISVTHKVKIHEGATRNDYCSLAKYWWPNPETANALPYIKRDGDINPDCYSSNYDVSRLESFSESTVVLSLAAYFTGDMRYAKKARELINTWFVNPSTRQTPHFKYAQIIPGQSSFRIAGLIEARRLIYVVEAIQLLHHLDVLSNEEYEQCIEWFSELLTWILDEDREQKIKKQQNNIGFWIDLQCLVYAKFSGKQDVADRVICEFTVPRFDIQIDEDGKLPKELTRAKPYDYVAFTLLAMAGLSAASENGEISLAEYSTEEGRSFQNAFNWLNTTFNSNDLQASSIALGRLVSTQQQLNSLKAKNKELEAIISENGRLITEELQKHNESDFQRVSNKLRIAERECERLRLELNENYRMLMNSAFQYRGIDFLVEEQVGKINQLKAKNVIEIDNGINLKDKLDNTERELEKQVEDLENTRNKLEEQVKLYEIEYIKTQNLQVEIERQKELEKQLKARLDETEIRLNDERNRNLNQELELRKDINNYQEELINSAKENSQIKEEIIKRAQENNGLREQLINIILENKSIKEKEIELNQIINEQIQQLDVYENDLEIGYENQVEALNTIVSLFKDLKSEISKNHGHLRDKYELLHEIDMLKNDFEVEKSKNRELSSLLRKKRQEDLVFYEENLLKTQKTLEAKKKNNKVISKKIETKVLKLNQVEEKYKNIKRERNRYRRLFNEMQSSRTWRYTLPARKMIDTIKKIGNK